ncbi:MAG: DUF4366 domain-containing protein [Lachnospiraceae bacterium]|nr:DUF4366 domain-containing protein [Lachnospiraceae bacterium]
MNKLEAILDAAHLNNLVKKKEEKKKCNVVLWVIIIVGAVIAISLIAYALYRRFKPGYLDEFDEEFDDEFVGDDEVFEDESFTIE